MTQDTAAAERSAHVLRGGRESVGTQGGPIVEVAPGYWKLRAIHELEVKLAAVAAERDSWKAARDAAEAQFQEAMARECAELSARMEAEAERDDAIKARNMAIREMAERAREAGSWRGIAEGKDIVIRRLEAERQRLRAALQSAITAMDMEGLSTADLRAVLVDEGAG